MSNSYDAGSQLRELLKGLLKLDSKGLDWGPRVQANKLPELYAPQKIKQFTPTRGGIDNLALSSTDTFLVPGKGTFEVKFSGYFKVAREDPTTNDWATSEVFVNMVDMALIGNSPDIGEIKVSINPEMVSSGQVFAAGGMRAAAKCRIAAGVMFAIPAMGVSLFNKEPILLMNDGIDSVPPVEDPNGVAHIYNLPLYSTDNPDGKPLAYLISLKYTVGNYLTESQVNDIRAKVGR